MEAVNEVVRMPCPIERGLQYISGRWKLLIVRELLVDTRRFGALQRALTGVTQKMLTQQLRELESDGIVIRHVYPVVPPKVEYSLTERGKRLQLVLTALAEWGQDLPMSNR